jgi:23S rRNA (uracil1939-C5)-methyltransferase
VDEIELVVERIVSGGEGFARFNGIPVFIPRSAPGDRLRVRLTERKPDYGRAEIVEILEPGPDRREPPCPYFTRCGGCDLQHLDDRAQVVARAAATRETLERLGGLDLDPSIPVIEGPAWGYRLRTQLHVETDEERLAVGYFERGSHRLVAVEECPVCVPELEAAIAELRDRPAGSLPQRVDLACGDGALTTAPVIEGLPHGEVSMVVAGRPLAFDARCFFQGNRHLLAPLVECVVGDWTGNLAFDLYGGVGLFALAATANYERVTMVESDRIAARYARLNARRNRATPVEVVHSAIESWLGRLPRSADRVIVDPPRAGLSRPIRAHLRKRPPQRLTYVSCHPAAMARDLRALSEVLSLEELTFVDLFPQTGHMEAVAQLVAR